jgi:hypothetical protein
MTTLGETSVEALALNLEPHLSAFCGNIQASIKVIPFKDTLNSPKMGSVQR